MHSETRIGLFGIGLDSYWPQFKGLKRRLEGYLAEVHRLLERPGVVVVNLGLVDTPAKAFEATHRFHQKRRKRRQP
jgi:L-arabinose isomerase